MAFALPGRPARPVSDRNDGAASTACTVLALTLALALFAPPLHAQPPAKRPAGTSAAGRAAPSTPGHVVEPAPAWVETLEADAALIAQLPRAPLQLLLDDNQVRLDPKGPPTRYVHVIRQISDTGGLQAGAQLQVNFDPSYERLALHRLVVWRDGQRIDKLPGLEVRLLHRETQLERQMVDGRRTASIVLDDVRVGDRVEYAMSLRGANPVFGGRYGLVESTVNQNGPTALVRYRFLAPRGRELRVQADPGRHQLSSRSQGDWTETTVRRTLAPQAQADAHAPAASFLPDHLQVSEFANWAEVARWGADTFAPATRSPSPAVLAEAQRLRQAAGDDPAELLRHTLDFVQTQVRYFGTEIGVNSHRPADPDTVLRQRFGDCKDKTALLIALLQAQGIRATPVLVSTYLRQDLDRMLPSPMVFDHVVARVDLPGIDGGLLLDGTRSRQTGPLAERQSLGLGLGLAADAQAQALAALPDARAVLHADGDDQVVFTRLDADPVLNVQLTYQGEIAENLRAVLDQQASQMERALAAEYARHYPGAELARAMEAEEVAGRNALRLTLGFRLPHYLRLVDGKQLVGEFGLPLVASELRLPDQAPRERALRLAQPGRYRHAVEFRLPADTLTREGRTPVDHVSPHFELHSVADTRRDRVRLSTELVVRKDRVEAAEWAAHRDQLRKVWASVNGQVSLPTLDPAKYATLMDRLKAAAEAAQSGRDGLKTEVQRTARAKAWLLQAQLDSGRLPPRARAEVLAELGMQQDHGGQRAEAAESFAAAVALDPQNAAAHAGLAVNALLRGDDALALAHAGQALQLDPAETGPRYTRAYAHYYAGRTEAARDELLDLLSRREEVNRGYATLWLHLATLRLGGDPVAATAPYQPAAEGAQATPAWPYPLVRLLDGRHGLDEALAAAREDAREAPGRLCELYFFRGQQLLLAGQTAAAREAFQKAVDTGVLEFNEHALARRELQRLAGR